MEFLPAYSAAFSPDNIKRIPAVHPLDDITADWAWKNSTGAGVKVAVIDSGIDASHPAIGGKVDGYVAITEGPNGLECDERPHEDLFGHGTAGAAIIRSLAPDCELYSVRVLDNRLTGK